MRWIIFLAASISTASFASSECKKTNEYFYFQVVSAINDNNYTIRTSKEDLKKYQALRPTPRVNEKINYTIVNIQQAEYDRNHLFKAYKKMGGQANNFNSLERLKNPCAEMYSDDHPAVKYVRHKSVPDKIQHTPRTQTPMQEHFIKPHQQEYNHNPFKR